MSAMPLPPPLFKPPPEPEKQFRIPVVNWELETIIESMEDSLHTCFVDAKPEMRELLAKLKRWRDL